MIIGYKKYLVLFIVYVFCIPQFLTCSATQKISFPEQEKTKLTGKSVIVSNFFVSSKITWKIYDGKVDYRTGYDRYLFKTDKDLRDVSHLLAKYLNRHGICARAVKKLNFKQVKKNELVITGAAQITARDGITALNVGCLLIMVGAILPNPLGFKYGADVKYTFLIFDSEKKIIYNRDIQEGEVHYKWYWLWPSLDEYHRSYKQARPVAIEEIFKDVLNTLK